MEQPTRAFSLDPESGCSTTTTLNRSKQKNPLSFESYAETRDHFRDLVYSEMVKAVVITGAGKNFCSGGDVSKIIGTLTKMSMKELLVFTRMTGDLVKVIRNCRQPAIAAVEGFVKEQVQYLPWQAISPHSRSNSFFVKSVPYEKYKGASEDQKLIIASQTLKEKAEYFPRNTF